MMEALKIMDSNILNRKVESVKRNEELPFKGIIFDMDGTLIESTEADYVAWQKTFFDNGKELSFYDYKPLLGMKSVDVIRLALGVTDEDEVKRLLEVKMQYFRDIVRTQGIQPVAGAKELLQQVRELPVTIALATSSRKAKMSLVMLELDFLKYFDVLVTGEEVTNSKPAPDIFLLAAERLGFAPGDCLVIEDAMNGVRSAKNAGMKCIAISTTHSADLLTEADLVIDSFENIDFASISRQLV